MNRFYIVAFIILSFPCLLKAQKTANDVKLKDLAVPHFPAFMLLDISPVLIENPGTPKEFAFGALQAFEADAGWPQNYAMEFTPFWWLNPAERSVYQFLGLKKAESGSLPGKTIYQPFSAMRFTSVSLAFVNKDLIPDVDSQNQKIFSVGIHSNILKYNRPAYAAELDGEINNWHRAVQEELAVLQEQLNQEGDPARRRKLQQQLNNKVFPVSSAIAQNINRIINQKPLFSWDVSAAFSVYGVNNKRFKSGRSGFWTTLATYIPLGKKTQESEQNYLDLLISSRYIHDPFSLYNDQLERSDNFDAGGKIAVEFTRVSFAVESLQRFYSQGGRSSANRTVGTISYRLDNNLYISGSFGNDFGPVNKIITLLGINWGFGEEKIGLPEPPL